LTFWLLRSIDPANLASSQNWPSRSSPHIRSYPKGPTGDEFQDCGLPAVRLFSGHNTRLQQARVVSRQFNLDPFTKREQCRKESGVVAAGTR